MATDIFEKDARMHRQANARADVYAGPFRVLDAPFQMGDIGCPPFAPHATAVAPPTLASMLAIWAAAKGCPARLARPSAANPSESLTHM